MTHPTTAHAHHHDPLAEFRGPPGTRELGMWIGLTAMLITFLAGLTAYVILCYRHGVTGQALPRVFWFSSFVVLISSVMLQYALVSARMGHERICKRATLASAGLGLLFLILQVPGMAQLIAAHRVLVDQQVFIYGLLLVLIGLHAAHMLGGMLPLATIARRQRDQPVTGQTAETLRVMAMYWHTLTLVWMGMFMVFLLVG